MPHSKDSDNIKSVNKYVDKLSQSNKSDNKSDSLYRRSEDLSQENINEH